MFNVPINQSVPASASSRSASSRIGPQTGHQWLLHLGSRRFRTLGFALAWLCLAPADVFACRPKDERVTFFVDVPVEISASTIARVTIVELIRDNIKRIFDERDYVTSFVGLARVDEVIKGQIGKNDIVKVISPNTSCYHEFSVGSTGVVVGELRRNADGGVELILEGAPAYKRQPSRNAK